MAKLHLEPLWWGLFSAGGVCFAVFVPAALLVFGVLWPLGVLELSFAQLQQYYFSIWGLLFSGAVVCLPLFHAAHRIRHGLLDLKVHRDKLAVVVCYGMAALLSAAILIIWAVGFLSAA